MYIKLEKLEEEIHTLYDLKYGETNEKVGKWEMHTVDPVRWW
jgi:hypothetical protein